MFPTLAAATAGGTTLRVSRSRLCGGSVGVGTASQSAIACTDWHGGHGRACRHRPRFDHGFLTDGRALLNPVGCWHDESDHGATRAASSGRALALHHL